MCREIVKNNNEKNNPENAHKKNAFVIPERRIIFFIKIASVPEKIRARTLYKIALELILLCDLIPSTKYVPNMIKAMPKKAVRLGISFIKIL